MLTRNARASKRTRANAHNTLTATAHASLAADTVDPLQAALEAMGGSGRGKRCASTLAGGEDLEALSLKLQRSASRGSPAKPSYGIGSPRHADRLQRSLERCGNVTRRCVYTQLARAPLEPIDLNVDTSGVEPPPPHTRSHSGPFIPSSGHILDDRGAGINWPWERGSTDWKPTGIFSHGIGQPRAGPARPSRVWHPLDASVNAALDMASRDGKRGRTTTGVRAWFSFCEDTMGTQAERPIDPNEPLWVKLEEEWLAMRFVIALVEERGVLPETARQYFSLVQGWHAREHGVKLAGGLKLERLPQMLKGLRKIVGDAPRAIRRGIAPAALKKAMDLLLDPTQPAHANIRAALATALQGLLRSAEYCGTKGALMLTRADLVQLNSEQMVVMMHPCKNMHHLSGKTCPLVIGAGGEHVDAVAEVRNMLKVDPHHPSQAASTPLFRVPDTNEPLSYAFVLDVTKQLMRAIGEDPAQFGTHSYRIGGATALFAAGANETVIRTMGRWSSDLHRLYVRACFEQCVSWTRRAGSADVSDLSGAFDEVDDY